MRVIIFILSILIISNLQAQKNVEDTNQYHNIKNSHYFNLSVGFFNPVDFAFSLANINSVNGSPSPALNFDYNYGVNQNLSIGAFANFYRVNAQYNPKLSELENMLDESLACTTDITDLGDILNAINCISAALNDEINIEERLNVFSVGGKLSLHKRIIPKLDTYAATYFGISFNSRESIVESALEEFTAELLNQSSVEIPEVMYLVNAGARYYLNKNIGIYGEVGYGNIHLAKLGLTYRF